MLGVRRDSDVLIGTLTRRRVDTSTCGRVHATPPDAEASPFAIDAITDTWNAPTADGWADVTVNGHMRDDTNQHKCEIAIIHKALMDVRESMGGDEFFTGCRR